MFGNDLVRFGPVRFGNKNSGSVRFGGSVKILVRSNTIKNLSYILNRDFKLRQSDFGSSVLLEEGTNLISGYAYEVKPFWTWAAL